MLNEEQKLAVLSHVLKCNKCNGSMDYKNERFTCQACGAQYEYRQHVVWALGEDAKIDEGFNLRWKNNPESQRTTSYQMLQSKIGLTPEDIVGRLILDAGCGCGRFAKLCEQHGATMIALDLSPEGCLAAAEKQRCQIVINGDILNLPLQASVFDAAYSIGVIHHTPSPKDCVAALSKVLRSGGKLGIWVYSPVAPYTDPKYLPVQEFFHEVTRACPPDKLYAAVAKWAVPMRDAYAGEWNILNQILSASNSQDAAECISDTFDWHCPQYRSRHTQEELNSWFAAAGLQILWQGDFPSSAMGSKV